jgi:hypothetical protein
MKTPSQFEITGYNLGMKKIILDGKEVENLVPESLPMLIHGKEGSGASLYTVCVAAKWFSQGYKILFLCGYKKAEEQFAQQVGSDYKNITFYTKEKVEEFITALKQNLSDKTIVIIKNIELFGAEVFEAINEIELIIVSGDVEESSLKERLLNKKFATKVFFSPLKGIGLPELKNYQGFVISDDFKGITQLQL